MDLLLADGIGRPAREIPAVPYFICLRRTSRGGFAMVSVKASRTFRPEKKKKNRQNLFIAKVAYLVNG